MTRAEAKAQGLKRYFTGKPCPHGHISERHVSSMGCLACNAERVKLPYQNDPDVHAKQAKYRRTPKRRAYMAEYNRQYSQDPGNRAKINERRRTPEFRAKQLEYERQQYQSDPNYRLACNLRSRVYGALKTGVKSARTMELIGCTIEQLWDHLEHQFQPGMTRENMGSVWHHDHIKPCASFNLEDPAQQSACFGFMNLQPLFGAENIAKGAKLETEEQFVNRTERFWSIAS
jgi:hypothetical protein